jgi:4-amino-4-deoxy-L-arabinose transferase-like glycosyltransferase
MLWLFAVGPGAEGETVRFSNESKAKLRETAKGMPLGPKKPVWLCLCFVVLAGLYFFRMDADPPAKELDSSRAWLTDEGHRSYAARDIVLHHLPYSTLASWNGPLPCLPLFFIQYPLFKVFSPGFVQARLAAVAYAIGALFFFGCALFTLYGEVPAIAGLLLLGFNPAFFFCSRLAMAEAPLLFFMMAAFFFIVRAWKGRTLLIAVAGGLLAMAYATKPHALPMLLSYLAALLAVPSDRKKDMKNALLFFAGFCVAWGLIRATVGIMGADDLFFGVRQAVIQDSLKEHLNLLDGIGLFPGSPIFHNLGNLLYLGLLFTAVLIARALVNRAGLERAEVFCGFWIFFQASMVVSFSYQPLRYHVALVPPLCIGTVMLLLKMRPIALRGGTKHAALFTASVAVSAFIAMFVMRLSPPGSGMRLLLSYTAAALVFSAGSFFAFMGFSPGIIQVERKRMILFSSVAAGFAFVLFWATMHSQPFLYTLGLKAIIDNVTLQPVAASLCLALLMAPLPFALALAGTAPDSGDRYSRRRASWLLAGVVSFVIVLDIMPISRWVRYGDYSLVRVSRLIGQVCGENAVLFSKAANTLTLENQLYAVNGLSGILDLLPYFAKRGCGVYVAVTDMYDNMEMSHMSTNVLEPSGIREAVKVLDADLLYNYNNACFCRVVRLEVDTAFDEGRFRELAVGYKLLRRPQEPDR